MTCCYWPIAALPTAAVEFRWLIECSTDAAFQQEVVSLHNLPSSPYCVVEVEYNTVLEVLSAHGFHNYNGSAGCKLTPSSIQRGGSWPDSPLNKAKKRKSFKL
jgi:hypothetical protein